MSLQGNIHDMSVADLIQHNCLDRKKAKITITSSQGEAELFFRNGEVVHASLNDLEGEEVVYRILAWDEGSFTLANEAESPKVSINRSWSGLLIEGARRLDEGNLNPDFDTTDNKKNREVPFMALRIDELLEEVSAELNGFMACAVAGMDGLTIAQKTKGKVNPEQVAAQMSVLMKLVGANNEKISLGTMEDLVLQTEDAFLMAVFLPGDQTHYLSVIVDRKSGTLGNMRLISKVYAERIAKAMPR